MTAARLTRRAIRLLAPVAMVALSACTAAGGPSVAISAAPSVNAPELAIASDAAADSLMADVQIAAPDVRVQLRYATRDNFTGAPLAGYEGNHAYLRREAALALARVATRARAEGVRLLVYDAYRPARATDAMVEWTRRTGREDLLRDGYIASRSRHNLGLAIDLTLVDSASGAPLDMGTAFDTFSSRAHTANATGAVRVHRRLLQRLMELEGFVNYDQEWWHYSYSVPDPVRFDRVIR